MTLRKIASLLLLALDVVVPKGAESKPFRKVLILSGGELRFSAGLAMLATLYQRGWVPDVTIYTCGFSMVPGAYLNSLTQLQPGQPDPAKWYEAALSDEYFRIMQRVKVNKDFFSRVVDKDGNTASSLLYGQMTSRIAGMQLKKGVNKASELPFLSSLLGTNPNPFRMTPVAIYPVLYRDNKDTLLDVPFDLSPPGMNIPFSANKMRAIIVATKILYSRELQDKPRPEDSKPLYQEVVFTDRLTADEIARVKYEKSPIAKMLPSLGCGPGRIGRYVPYGAHVARRPHGRSSQRTLYHRSAEHLAHRISAFAGRRGDGHSDEGVASVKSRRENRIVHL
jgi:hypothetical protein